MTSTERFAEPGESVAEGGEACGLSPSADESVALPPDPHPSVEVVLTPMRRRHVLGVLRVDRLSHPRPWTLGLYLGELARPDTRAYTVARAGAGVIGFAGVMVIGDEGHITTVGVDPAWRRRGIASNLMAVTTRRAIALGAEHLTLEVRVSNTAAQEMYRRFGYAPAGVRPRYYAENNEDALIMWAHDVALPEYQARLAAIEEDLAGTVVHQGFSHE